MWQIFPSFLVIVAISLAVVTWYATTYFKAFYLETIEQNLSIQAKLVRLKIAGLDSQFFHSGDVDQFCKQIGEQTGTRFTIILPTGEVIGDSFGDISQMENHRRRPEIAQALKWEKGITIRYSNTLDQNMMYVALPVVEDGRVLVVIRTSLSVSSIDHEIMGIKKKVFYVFSGIILISALVSLMVARRIARPIEEMKTGALKFLNGQLENRLAVPDTEELSELAITMNKMAASLDEKITAFKNRSRELEAVHSSMKEGVIAIDPDEKIITINDTAAGIFGFKPGQLCNRFVLEVVRNLAFQEFIKKALSTPLPVEEDISIIQETKVVLNIHSTALYDSENHRIGTLIIFHDITRIRRLETLHKEFAANVSHELKTPMTSIKGFVETLQGMIDGTCSEDALKFLAIIKNNIDRLICLVDDLLALSKLERLEDTGAVFDSFCLMQLIDNSIKNCKILLDEKQIKVQVTCPEKLTVKADPLLMEQAISNLVDNAVKYSDPQSDIFIEATEKDSGVSIKIRDTGSGIENTHLPRIFNRFYRVDKARSRDKGGTGLGLAIVKHIIHYHRGKITVSSVPYKGTIFEIHLPGNGNEFRQAGSQL